MNNYFNFLNKIIINISKIINNFNEETYLNDEYSNSINKLTKNIDGILNDREINGSNMINKRISDLKYSYELKKFKKNYQSDKYEIDEKTFFENFPLDFITNFDFTGKNCKLLDHPVFVEFYCKLLEFLIFGVSFAVHNLSDFLPKIVEELNNNTRPNFIILDCKMGNHSYGCGRAINFRIEPGKNARIFIFDTDDDMQPQYLHLLKTQEKTAGGYYKKYIKYKTKYLKLKSEIL